MNFGNGDFGYIVAAALVIYILLDYFVFSKRRKKRKLQERISEFEHRLYSLQFGFLGDEDLSLAISILGKIGEQMQNKLYYNAEKNIIVFGYYLNDLSDHLKHDYVKQNTTMLSLQNMLELTNAVHTVKKLSIPLTENQLRILFEAKLELATEHPETLSGLKLKKLRSLILKVNYIVLFK